MLMMNDSDVFVFHDAKNEQTLQSSNRFMNFHEMSHNFREISLPFARCSWTGATIWARNTHDRKFKIFLLKYKILPKIRVQ